MGKLNRSLTLASDTIPKLEELHERAQGNRPKRRWYLIVCEGERTEPNYFESFRKCLYGGEGDKIVVHGAGDNTLNLIDIAREAIARRLKSGDPPFYYVWLVFDRDSFPPDDFDNTIQLVEEEDLKFNPESGCNPHWRTAWSNEAFELWYLYHFQEVQGGAMSRTVFQDMLSAHMGVNYQKNDKHIFERLIHNLDKAIDRASRAELRWTPDTPYHERNPATTVHRLVSELIRYM